MIFVTLGSTDRQFNRLAKEIDRLIGEGEIKERVIMQVGYSDYIPKNMRHVTKPLSTPGNEWFRYTPDQNTFLNLMKRANTIVTHAGSGNTSIVLRLRKKMVVVPRRKRFGEHYNDHQLDLAKGLEMVGLAVSVYNIKDLGGAIKKAKRMRMNFDYIRNDDVWLKKFLRKVSKGKRVCAPLTPGGHFREAKPFLSSFDSMIKVTTWKKYLPNDVREGRVYYVRELDKEPILNILKSLLIVLRERPQVVFSTGAGLAIPIAYFSKFLFRARIIYIESFAQVFHKSWTGRLIYPIADFFFVRWKPLAKIYGKKAKFLNYV